MEVAGELEFFPTLDPAEEPFVVMDLARFKTGPPYGITRCRPPGPNELWIALTQGISSADGTGGVLRQAQDDGLEQDDGDGELAEPIAGALKDAGVSVRDWHDAQAMVAARLDQPLVNAGWGALLVLLFLAITLASASGLLLFSHLDANERQTEFALLRTLGISRGQMLTILWAGLSIMVLSGVALGDAAGLAPRRKPAAADGGRRGGRASHAIAGVHRRLAAVASILRYPGSRRPVRGPLAGMADGQAPVAPSTPHGRIILAIARMRAGIKPAPTRGS